VWPIAKSFIKKDGPKAPSAVHGPLGPIFYPLHKVNIIADCLEIQFIAHDLCASDHGRQVEAKIKALLATYDEESPVTFRLCGFSKEIKSLKLGKDCGFDGIQNESLRHLPRGPLVHLTHLFNYCLRFCHFPAF
jgi:hypothetical protein